MGAIRIGAALERRTFDTTPTRRVLVRMALATMASLLFLIARNDTGGRGLRDYIDFVEHYGMDIFFRLRGERTPIQKIVIVPVDFESFQHLQVHARMPWPRRYTGQIVEKVAEQGARLVLLDFFFSDSSIDPEDDRIFSAKIGKIPTFLGAVRAHRAGIIEDRLPSEQLSKNAAGVGELRFWHDSSWGLKLSRYFPLGRFSDSEYFPAVVEQVVKYLGCTDFPSRSRPKEFYLHYLNYYGPGTVFPTVSAWKVLAGDFDSALFKDAIVIVAPGMIEGGDRFSAIGADLWDTPFRTQAALGAALHATAIANIMQKDWISRLSPIMESEIQAFYMWFSIIVILLLPPSRFLVLGTCCVVGGAVCTSFLLFQRGVFLPLIIPSVVVLLTILLRHFWQAFDEARRRAELIEVFGSYLDPHMVQHYVESRTMPTLEGSVEQCALMFTDIVGFTSFSESRPAVEVGRWVNDYFGDLVEVLRDNQGTLLNYVGDGVFAIWGAPLKVERECRLALCAAQEILRRNDSSSKFKTRIGLHYGHVLVGNFGARHKINYSAMGDEVNLTSRLEGLNKTFGTQILLSAEFAQQLGETHEICYLGRVQVVGRKEPIGLYTLSDHPNERWAKALLRFESGELREAQEEFTAIKESQDVPYSYWAELYLCQMIQSPELTWVVAQEK
jgi:adenylate cyclase